MATIIQGPPDLRQRALQGGVERGIASFFEQRKKKKQEQKFVEAYRMVNQAPDYETAVRNMATLDPELLANPEAVKLINQQIQSKFPEQETIQVIDARTRQPRTFQHRKGAPPTDAELATRGLMRAENSQFGTQFAFDEQTGDVDVYNNVTPEEAQQQAPGRLVVDKEGSSSAAALMNAYNARLRARNTGKKDSKPTQFDQEVDAVVARYGLEDRNAAVNVVTNREPVLKDFRAFFTKGQGGEIYFTDDAARGHIANSETIIEPALIEFGNPDEVRKLMSIDTAFNIANDSDIQVDNVKTRAQNDFMRLTGISAQDTGLRDGLRQADVALSDGQVAEINVKQNGQPAYRIRVVKIAGRVIPLGRVD